MKTKNRGASVLAPESFISSDEVDLYGELDVPEGAPGVVLFAHGSGSSRHSPRNQFVARTLREAGIGTLLFDLLTPEEEEEDVVTGAYRFDIKLLAKRLLGATLWLEGQPEAQGLRIGYFGASTGGGAALMAAAALGDRLAGVVSRGGRPDLAGEALPNVKCPTLLIVGGLDDVVIQLNREAFSKLRCEKEMKIIPGASHLFPETGKLDEVAHMCADWFHKYMTQEETADR
jgi:putative phosphoribosyl transferase